MNCSTTRKTTAARQQTESKTELHTTLAREARTDSSATTSATDTRHDKLNSETTTERASDEEIVTIVREYATDKPTDVNTGTPPLKREITRVKRKTDTGRQARTTEQTTDRHREAAGQVDKRQTGKTNLQQQTQQQDDTTARVNTSEKRGLNAMQRVLCTLGGLLILGALVWLGWKFKRHL